MEVIEFIKQEIYHINETMKHMKSLSFGKKFDYPEELRINKTLLSQLKEAILINSK